MTDEMETAEHTHPDESDAVDGAFERGDDAQTVADGSSEDDRTDVRMRDVAHTPPHGKGTNDVWSRGEGDVDAPPVRGPTDDE